ncbi:MAG: hypothetical protein NVSMB31_12520 [Vulcanimicrobiaceae bacterium]
MFPARAFALALALLAASTLAACAPKHPSQGVSAGDAAAPLALDARRGKQLFAANCAACHGAGGLGGPVGPALHNEKARKSLHEIEAWIKEPQPPMPKLYPGSLSEGDVGDLAAYVQSL